MGNRTDDVYHSFGKLTALLQPTSLSITNDSWQHRHHTAMREQGGGNGETRMSRVLSINNSKAVFRYV